MQTESLTRKKPALFSNQPLQIKVEEENLPQAGRGACRMCACKKFVPGKDNKHSHHLHEATLPNPCECGHDMRMHD